MKKVEFSHRLLTGAVRIVGSTVFNTGNFVDVMATLDITTFKGRYQVPTVKVHFSFESVIQLCARDSVPMVRHVHTLHFCHVMSNTLMDHAYRPPIK